MSNTRAPLEGTNLAVVVGLITRAPQRRSLACGDEVVALELRVQSPGMPPESVPVAWPGAPDAVGSWPVGEEILVVGRVRRRFFRAGGATQSRTEVVAATVIPTRRAANARRALSTAVAALAGGEQASR